MTTGTTDRFYLPLIYLVKRYGQMRRSALNPSFDEKPMPDITRGWRVDRVSCAQG